MVGTASYLGATLAWGMNIPLTAMLLGTWDPYFLALLRVGLATLAFALLVMLIERRHHWKPAGITPVRLFLTGGAFAAFLLLYNLGLNFSDPVTAAAIMAGTPVYAAITLRLATGSRLERGFVVAATLTVVGAAIAVFWGGSGATKAGFRGGEVCILLSFVFWNLYTLGTQLWFRRDVSQLRRIFSCYLMACGWLAGGWLLLSLLGVAPTPNLAPSALDIGLLVLTATVATAGGVLLWQFGVAKIGLATGSLWQNMVPVFGILIGVFLGFIPTFGQIAGGLIVLSGVLWMQWQKTRT